MSANPDTVVRLPQIEQVLQQPFLSSYIKKLSRPIVTQIVRDRIAKARAKREFMQPGFSLEGLYEQIGRRCQQVLRQRHSRVINGTGVAIHTNLGRSPIAPDLWEAVSEVNTGYCNLEIKLSDGKRGQRKGLVAELIGALTGSEDALVVNNNAASIYLMLNELARGKEVIVSRGEQIQIGGGFRIPDILALSGAKLVEVGTTNITTADDYLNAVTENTAMVLMVHCSNFAIRGFTSSPNIQDVAKHLPEHVILAVDQGSGLTTERFAQEETPVAHYLRQGADIVCFSGDKIIGGPQAGIVCGRHDLVRKLDKNPLMRAFRPGRMVYSLLEELLVRKLNKEASGLGVAERTVTDPNAIRARGERLCQGLEQHLELVSAEMTVGGGTLPDETFPSWALELKGLGNPQKVLDDLRHWPIPLIGVIRNERVQINLATILPHEEDYLKTQLERYLLS